jgi:hypothetical protein
LNDVPGAVLDYKKALQLKPDDLLSRENLQKLLINNK